MNMRFLYLLTFVLLSSAKLFASQPDSASVQAADTVRALDEVVVSARNTRIIKNGVSVVPTVRAKRSATDGVDLLRRMMIPSLYFNGEKVTTSTGRDVKYFIDSIPVDESQVKVLRGRDIRRVEVLENPSDPRFEGARAVVNYLTVKWEYGGYTKLSASQTFFIPSGNYGLYSKYVQGKSTFEVSATGSWLNSQGRTLIEDATMRFPSASGTDIVHRHSETDEGKTKTNRIDAGIRWSYSINPSSMFKAYIGLSNFIRPGSVDIGRVWYDGDHDDVYNSMSFNRNRSTTPALNMYYYTYFKNGSFISSTAEVSTSTNKNRSLYILSSDMVDNLANSSSEQATSYSVNVNYGLPLRNGLDNLYIGVSGAQDFFRTDYSGTANDRFKLNNTKVSASAMYYFTLSNSWNGSAAMTGTLTNSDILGNSVIRHFIPDIFASISGNLNQNNSISFEANVYKVNNEATAYNTVRQQLTELLGTQGNPDVKNSICYNLSGSYNWIATRHFSLNFGVSYLYTRHAQLYMYVPVDGIMYQTEETAGNRSWYTFKLSTPISLGNGKVRINPAVDLRHIHSNGLTPLNIWGGYASLSVYYYPSSVFSANMTIDTDYGKSYGGTTGEWYNYHEWPTFSAGVNYTPGNWNISTRLSNIMNRRTTVRTHLNTLYYDFSRQTKSNSGFAAILSVSYTFDYGKKVGRGSEYRAGNASKTSVRSH